MCFSQEYSKWGQVSNFEKEYTQYKKDTSAIAVNLFSTCKLSFENDMDQYEHLEYSYHYRQKVLRSKGVNIGSIKIVYYSKDGIEEVLNLEAQVIQPTGEIIKIPKDKFFTTKKNEYYSIISFAFPDLHIGSIIEYKYTLVDQDLHSNKYWYFQNRFPTIYSKFEYGQAIYYSYNSLFFPGFEMQLRDQVKDKSIKSLDTIQKEYFKDDFNIKVKDRIYISRNAPPIIEDDYMTNIDDYRAKIILQLESFQLPYHSERQEQYSTWSNLAKFLQKNKRFGNIYKKKRPIKKLALLIAPNILESLSSDEKIEILYSFVNENITWNGDYSAFFNEKSTPYEIYKNALGSSGEINLIFLALCNYFDIEAKPVLISTRSNGRLSAKTPIVSQFNHVLILANYNGVDKLIDLGQKLRPIGVISQNSVNSIGWLVDDEKSPKWIELKGDNSLHQTISNIKLNKNGQLDIMTRTIKTGYIAIMSRINTPKSNNKQLANIEQIYGENYEVINYKYKNLATPTIPLITTVELLNEDFMDLSSVVIEPFITPDFKEMPFQKEKRFFPIDFTNPFTYESTISVLFDKSYNIVSLPTSSESQIDDDIGYSFKIITKGNNIQIKSVFYLNKLHYSATKYKSIKSLFHQYFEKTMEGILLQKRKP